jgi:hypothetical protein
MRNYLLTNGIYDTFRYFLLCTFNFPRNFAGKLPFNVEKPRVEHWFHATT